jgi:hypothetical protein
VATWDSPAPSPSPTPSPTPAPTSIPTGIPLYAPASRRPSTLAGLLGRRGLRVVPDGAFEWLC